MKFTFETNLSIRLHSTVQQFHIASIRTAFKVMLSGSAIFYCSFFFFFFFPLDFLLLSPLSVIILEISSEWGALACVVFQRPDTRLLFMRDS